VEGGWAGRLVARNYNSKVCAALHELVPVHNVDMTVFF
jgi:hypothetical protein